MKKTAIFSLLLSCVAPAMAAEGYIGAGVGRAKQMVGAESFSLSTASTSAKFFGGYQFDNAFGIEGGYTYFGEASVSAAGTTVSLKPKSFYAAMTGRLALGPGLFGYAKLGVARPGTTGRMEQEGAAEVVDTHRATPMVGLGVSYSLTKQVALVTEYEYYGKAVKDAEGYLKLDHLSVGVRYNF